MSAAGPKAPKAPRRKAAPATGAAGEPRGKKPRAAKASKNAKGSAPPPVDPDEETDAEVAEDDSPEAVVAEVAGAVAPGAGPGQVAVVPEVLPPEHDLEAAEAEPAQEEADAGEDNAPLDGVLLAPPSGEASRLPVPVGRDLSRADALQRYLAEISRHPLLTREQEHDLAARFKETQDPKLAYRLVTANLRLVVKIAMEYRRAAFSVLDLIQEGNVGLMQAVQKYDPYRGVKLSSYSAWWIRAYILRYLMDNWRMVKLGTTQAQRKLFFNLRKEQEKLLSQGFEAAPKLLAEKLEVSEQDVREMDQRLGNDEFSLDTPVAGSDDSRQTYVDRLAENRSGAEEQLGDEELRRVFKEQLAAFGKTLTDPRDRFLFEKRISVLDGAEPLTLQQVGEEYGFTRERARQLEARLTGQLRQFLRARMPDFAQLSMNEPEED